MDLIQTEVGGGGSDSEGSAQEDGTKVQMRGAGGHDPGRDGAEGADRGRERAAASFKSAPHLPALMNPAFRLCVYGLFGLFGSYVTSAVEKLKEEVYSAGPYLPPFRCDFPCLDE